MQWFRLIGIGLVLTAAGRGVAAQSVQALVDATTVGTEEIVTYSIEVSTTDLSQVATPTPPGAQGLELLSPSPSRSTNMSWVNGNVTQSITFSWRYRPLSEGEARIEQTTVNIADTPNVTAAITLQVVPQSQRPTRTRARRSIFDPWPDPLAAEPDPQVEERDIFIQAIPSSTTPFVNEQVTVSYELVFREGMLPRNSRITDSWDAEGFWREDLPVEGRPMPRTTILDGLRYNAIVVKRIAVFPTRPGRLTIDPLRIATDVFAPASRGLGGIFSRRPAYQEVLRSSPEIAMEVKPLPRGAPNGYQDAVGTYEMNAQLSRSEVDVGEPVELTIQISGEGNISTLEGPDVTLPGAFEQYDPEVSTRSRGSAQVAAGTKTYSYVMIPRTNGEFSIAPLRFSFFDPKESTYRTIERALPPIRVSGTATEDVPLSTFSSGFPVDDIAPPLPPGRWVPYPPRPLHLRWWIYVALVAPLLAMGVVALWRRHTVRMETDLAWARGKRAHPLAKRHLRRAVKLHRRDEARALFEELERAVLGFICDRMNISERGLTRPQLLAALQEAGVQTVTLGAVQEFLSECDAARFSPSRPDRARMDQALQTAAGLIARLKEVIRA